MIIIIIIIAQESRRRKEQIRQRQIRTEFPDPPDGLLFSGRILLTDSSPEESGVRQELRTGEKIFRKQKVYPNESTTSSESHSVGVAKAGRLVIIGGWLLVWW